MKIAKQLLVIVALVAGSFVTGGQVSAQEDCTITNTGPGSTNECVTETTYTCEVIGDNEIRIINSNDQEVYSGPADVTDNTDSGNATSGSVTNNNGTTFDIQIENDVCVASEVEETPEPEEPVTPTDTVTPTEEAEPVVLAETAGNDMIQLLIVLGAASLTIAAGTLAVTRFAKR